MNKRVYTLNRAAAVLIVMKNEGFSHGALVAFNQRAQGQQCPAVRCEDYSKGAMTKLTIAITLIKIFIEGPEVSLKGSPTVSPTTVAA